MQQSAADHLRILAALENKDAPAARQALSQHIHYALSKVELALSGVLDHAQRKRSE
jgi:DNA-binding GntR family transcriptional regulator